KTAAEPPPGEKPRPGEPPRAPQRRPAKAEKAETAKATVRVDTEKLDVLVNLIAELVINHNKMEQEIRALRQHIVQLGETLENLKSSRKKAVGHAFEDVAPEKVLEPLARLLPDARPEPDRSLGALTPGALTSLRAALREQVVRLYEHASAGEQNLDWLVGELAALKSDLDALFIEFQNDGINIGRVIDDLQDETMKLRMLPISQVFSKFPRKVRDIARSLGKKVDFVMEGEETELDKTLIEEIEDPLMHLIRNAIDHGIETTEERTQKGKPETGMIRLTAYHEGNSVVVEVEDDGKGMDPERIRRKALERRLISEEEAAQMDDRQALNLIFIPGFSTKEEVTDLSGRGVGMDVVKDNIHKLKGTVRVRSVPGEGTVFKLKLPLTLAIIQSMIVKTGGMKFVIPMDPIEATDLLTTDKVSSVEGRSVFRYHDQVLPLVRLSDVFQIESRRDEASGLPVVIVGVADVKVGLVVDEVIEKQQVVIKTLGDFLGDVRHLVGATIFGDGSIALIIDVGGIVASVSQIAQRAGRAGVAAEARRAKKILLVDDSLSGRLAQRDMLERMGYGVAVASSGFKALEMLREEKFSAVVTDINMPRMDGYEFAAKMRASERTRRLPVIMVTSDIKRVDRDRGAEVGINEFLAKPFSDEDLRQAVEKHMREY
ncbi:MAG: response regulator, partial [bacterium]